MTDAEQEAVERLWTGYLSRLPAPPASFESFTAGYLAHQQAVAGEREHLEEAARILRMRPANLYEIEQRREAWDRWYEQDGRLAAEHLRRSKQEGSG